VRILLTGANGFIGGQLLAGLAARGHEIVGAVRNPGALRGRFPGVDAIAVDFNRDTSITDWTPRLSGIDAVINCAGVLHAGRGQNIEAIHAKAPIALFDACVAAGVRRVVQISAISADAEAGTVYALTKKKADNHLRTLPLDWTVLRPSLIYGEGSYGGTSALRGLAGLPLVTPMVGDGSTSFRPLHIDDLVESVVRVVESDHFAGLTLDPAGPEIVSLRDLVRRYRSWLGLQPALTVPIPFPVMALSARIADLGGGGPLGTASLEQLRYGNAGGAAAAAFADQIGFVPRTLEAALSRRPAQTQDLWHARLYFLRPVLRAALILLWVGSALAGLLAPVSAYADVADAFAALGLPARPLAIAFSVVDFLIAAALLFRWRPRMLAALQLTVVGGYTILLGALVPTLWLDPFGALLKNLPILAAICVWAILEEER
jgi:uncharacterized protein YbjT (DUF2867 family)